MTDILIRYTVQVICHRQIYANKKEEIGQQRTIFSGNEGEVYVATKQAATVVRAELYTGAIVRRIASKL